jgi:hypothetical protein
VLGHYTWLPVERGEGSWLHLRGGRRVFDLTCGIAVTPVGHAHPRVVAAVQQQVAKLSHICAGVALYEPNIALAERLVEIAPAGLDTVFFGNSGAEAIEGAVKLARQATGRQGVIVFRGGFHGRTTGAATLITERLQGPGPVILESSGAVLVGEKPGLNQTFGRLSKINLSTGGINPISLALAPPTGLVSDALTSQCALVTETIPTGGFQIPVSTLARVDLVSGVTTRLAATSPSTASRSPRAVPLWHEAVVPGAPTCCGTHPILLRPSALCPATSSTTCCMRQAFRKRWSS